MLSLILKFLNFLTDLSNNYFFIWTYLKEFGLYYDSKIKAFGTRHLAAIGITEVSDAFCVIVSEQTGRVSFTKDNEIMLDLSIEELFQLLTDAKKN